MFSKVSLVGFLFLVPVDVAHAKVFITLQEALQQAFPADKSCESKAENKYLTKAQSDEAKALSSYETASALVVRYSLKCSGKLAAYA